MLTRNMPDLALGPTLVLPVALGLAALFCSSTPSLVSHRRPASLTGVEGMQGAVGVALSPIRRAAPGGLPFTARRGRRRRRGRSSRATAWR